LLFPFAQVCALLHRQRHPGVMESPMHEFRVMLRHGRDATHVQRLIAPNRAEAIRLARLEAVEMSGGEPAGWQAESCEALPAAKVAA
jgi:hypothetical protein